MAFVAVLLNFAEAHLPTKVDSCLRCSGSCLGLQICRIAHAGHLKQVLLRSSRVAHSNRQSPACPKVAGVHKECTTFAQMLFLPSRAAIRSQPPACP